MMKNIFYSLVVKRIEKLTKDSINISFDVPENLKEIFNFESGQHLTLKLDIKGKEHRRNYSLCTSPTENEWSIIIKKVDGGVFSHFAFNNLKVGDTVEVLPPMGKFCFLVDFKADETHKNIVLIAAGSGITPIMSMLKYGLHKYPKIHFTLIYQNRHYNTIILNNEIQKLKNKYVNNLSVHHILSKEKIDGNINSGRLDSDKMTLIFTKLIPLPMVSDVFICGPFEMIESVKEYLTANNVDSKNIHYELFTAKSALVNKEVINEKSEISGNQSAISITIDGQTHQFTTTNLHNNILDEALEHSVGLPYACKGGVCCTCKAKLVEGKVEMLTNFGLEADEIANNYVLTCQCLPLTEKVVLNFDA